MFGWRRWLLKSDFAKGIAHICSELSATREALPSECSNQRYLGCQDGMYTLAFLLDQTLMIVCIYIGPLNMESFILAECCSGRGGDDCL